MTNSRISRLLSAAVAAGALALTPAFANDDKMMKQGSLSAQDSKFVMESAQGGMMEVQAGQLAVDKAQSAAVKDFGRRMVQDHSQANAKLEKVASAEGVTLPKAMSAEHRAHLDQLARLSGAAFDREYMKHMLQDHKKDVASFEKEAEKGDDPDVRGFARETLPTLREHLQLAERVASQVNGSRSGR
jgi:putative membrane protein